MSFLATYTVGDLPLPQPLVSLSHPGDGLFRAIEILAEHRLLSAPVLTASAADGGDQSREVLGMFEALDVVAHVVDLATQERELEDVAINSIMGCGRNVQMHATVHLDTPLDKVAELLSGPSRRAVVLGPEGQAHSVVTQSVLLKFLHSKFQDLDALKDLGRAGEICSKGAVCVAEDKSALEALQAICSNGVSSIGIVDEDGVLISVVSATDLVVALANISDKSALPRQLADMTALDFVASNRQADIRDRAATVTVPPDQDLRTVLHKLAATRVHRVMVCTDRRPIGVLSLTDLIRTVANKP